MHPVECHVALFGVLKKPGGLRTGIEGLYCKAMGFTRDRLNMCHLRPTLQHFEVRYIGRNDFLFRLGDFFAALSLGRGSCPSVVLDSKPRNLGSLAEPDGSFRSLTVIYLLATCSSMSTAPDIALATWSSFVSGRASKECLRAQHCTAR